MFAAIAVAAAVAVLAERVPAAAPTTTLRLGVVSFYNPRIMYAKYQVLADYLTRHTPWRFELDLTSSYQETVTRLCDGVTQVAYLGPYSYLRAAELCGVRPVVRLDTAKRPTYLSYIMVREDSPYQTLVDLRGHTFAFGARLSTSSHLMPRAMLLDAGLTPGSDLHCRYYGHHDQAARAVLMREAAACGIRDLTGERYKNRGLRVLAVSPPIPNFPLVVGPAAPPGVAEALVEGLVARPRRDAASAQAMDRWDDELSDGFARVTPNAYLPIASLARRVFGPQALRMDADALVCGADSRPPGR